MTAVEKLATLAAPAEADSTEDMAGVLVLAAQDSLAELRLLLADDNQDDEDEGDGEGGSHASHGTYKALIRKKVDPKRAATMCAQADKRVKAAALAEAAHIALSAIEASAVDWVEATAADTWTVAALAGKTAEGGPKKPYGNVQYADPGYQSDGKKRYPLDTEEHCRAALSYIEQEKNAAKYSPAQVASIKAKIKAAARKHGIQVSGDSDGEKAAATMLALASKLSDGGIPMNHGPFTGTHVHSHFLSNAHAHPHQHVGDNTHDGGPLHRPGSQPRRPNW
jgi:hypothetical protein